MAKAANYKKGLKMIRYCNNERCTVKKLCKRYENKPSSDFSFAGEGGKECSYYEEVNRWDLLNMYMLGHK